MGVVLDKGTTPAPSTPPQRSVVEHLGWASYLTAHLVILGVTSLMVLFVAVVAIATPSEGVAWFLLAVVTPMYLMSIYFFVQRGRNRRRKYTQSDVAPPIPADEVRSSLRFAPIDGGAKPHRLGAGHAHIVENTDSDSPYVIAIADNGIGVSKPLGSYYDARGWAAGFHRDHDSVSFATEVLFRNIDRVDIDGRTVTVGATNNTIELDGWFDPKEPTHRENVHRLLERLEFEEREDSPGSYEPRAIQDDPQWKAAS